MSLLLNGKIPSSPGWCLTGAKPTKQDLWVAELDVDDEDRGTLSTSDSLHYPASSWEAFRSRLPEPVFPGSWPANPPQRSRAGHRDTPYDGGTSFRRASFP